MEVYKLSQRRMYWEVKEDGTIPPMNCGWYKQGAGLKIYLDACNFPYQTAKMNKLLDSLMQSTKISKKLSAQGTPLA